MQSDKEEMMEIEAREKGQSKVPIRLRIPWGAVSYKMYYVNYFTGVERQNLETGYYVSRLSRFTPILPLFCASSPRFYHLFGGYIPFEFQGDSK